MGNKSCMVFLLFVVALGMVMEVKCATSPSPSSVDCSSLVLTMADCLSFVTNGSKVKKPEGGCCAGLKNVLKSNAECLCETFKSSSQLGIALNITKAATLPAACNVKAPSISNCGLSTLPGVSPTAAPANSPGAASGPGTADTAGTIGTTGGVSAPTPAPSGASVVSLSLLAIVSASVALCLYF